jgi:tetrahydromethanopterin S-methyltransferase subunit G
MSEDPTQILLQDGLRQILARLDSIDSRLTTLEDKVDRRLQETRPIWEQVLVRLEGVEQRMGTLESEMRTGFRKIDRHVGLLVEDVLKVRVDQRDLENIVDRLEPKPTQ